VSNNACVPYFLKQVYDLGLNT